MLCPASDCKGHGTLGEDRQCCQGSSPAAALLLSAAAECSPARGGYHGDTTATVSRAAEAKGCGSSIHIGMCAVCTVLHVPSNMYMCACVVRIVGMYCTCTCSHSQINLIFSCGVVLDIMFCSTCVRAYIKFRSRRADLCM